MHKNQNLKDIDKIMYKLEFWFKSFKGKLITSIIITVFVSLGLASFSSWLIKYLTTGPINNHAYLQNQNEGLTQAINYTLNTNNDTVYDDNVEIISTRSMFKMVSNNEETIGFIPIDPYLFRKNQDIIYADSELTKIFNFKNDYLNIKPLVLINSNYDYNLKDIHSRKDFLIEYAKSYPAVQTYNIFFNVDQDQAKILSRYLYGNNPEAKIWTKELYTNKYHVKTEEQAELALSFMFYNWLLYYYDSYYLMGEEEIYTEFISDKMEDYYFKNFSKNFGLPEYCLENGAITLNIMGPKESEVLIYKLIYTSKDGFKELCTDYLNLLIEFNFEEVSNNQLIIDSENDTFLKIQTRGLYENEINSRLGYDTYIVNENSYYSPNLDSRNNDYLLYYTFYERPIMFFINRDFVFNISNKTYINPNWITTNGLNMIYARNFSFEDLIIYHQMGEYKYEKIYRNRNWISDYFNFFNS